MPQPPYISRPEAEAFFAALQEALQTPAKNPVVFHLWGSGGVGKSTLLRKIIKDFSSTVAMPLVNNLPISFGLTEGIATPVDLMQKLHSLLEPQFLNTWFFGQRVTHQRDPFIERHTQFFDAIHQLERETPEGQSNVSADQLGIVKQLFKGLLQVGGAAATVTGNPIVGGALATASQGADAVVDGASLALSEKDRMQSLLQAHRATHGKRDLQALLLEPLPKLTAAFVERLSQWSQQKPIILMLDTYEKAELATIDTWLWQSLLSNTNIQDLPIRVVIAGRYNLLKRQEWATIQQGRDIVKSYGPEKFTPNQTQDYLANINRLDPATIQQVYQMTKGWPYYLNEIRKAEQPLTPDPLTQDLATFLVNHVPHEEQSKAKALTQIAACCRWFDPSLIEWLTQQLKIVPPTLRNRTSASPSPCFNWLREQTFVEPIASGRLRLDDVARDMFRASLWQENQPIFAHTHDLLARYFKAKSDQAMSSANTPTSENYENSDWRALRSEYLYHLLFAPQKTWQTTWVSHVLEATYLRQVSVVQAPLQAVMAESVLDQHPHLRDPVRKFLTSARPAIEYGWAVLEKEPIDYAFNETRLGLSKTATDTAIVTCLQRSEALPGLAQFVAAYYQARRCPAAQKKEHLRTAQAYAESLKEHETIEFMAGLYVYKLGSSFFYADLFEAAKVAYDAALAIKPNKHEALTGKGIALAELGRREEAIAAYDAALGIKPDYHVALYNKGVVLAELDRWDEAIAAFAPP
ncbi:MAG: tetratricopeptide repeat protein [Cyanobacteria bacterium J06638_20]